MTGSLQKFFLYPQKIKELIQQTQLHGDPIWAAKTLGIRDLSWVTDLLTYEGSEPEIRKAADDLRDARDQGEKQRPEYAKQLFILALSKHASISEACLAQPWYQQSFFNDQRLQDTAFDSAWSEAYEHAVDALRLEAWRRAVEGVDEPQVFKGHFCYEYDEETGKRTQIFVKKYSDALLQMLLKRFDPAFRDKIQVDQNTNMSGSLDVTPQMLASFSEAELQVLSKFVDVQVLTTDEDPDK